MSDNKVIVYSVIVSWASIICILLFLQFSSFQQIKELQKISVSQAFEIQQLKEELYHISFASLDTNIPINSKKLVLDSNTNYKLENYYNLEKMRISGNHFRLYHANSPIITYKNNNVKLLMIEGPANDELTMVKQFPNIEELVIIFHYPGEQIVDLSYLIYPSKIKKIVLLNKKNLDISPVVSYYKQQNKEVIVDERDNIGDIYTKYDLWN